MKKFFIFSTMATCAFVFGFILITCAWAEDRVHYFIATDSLQTLTSGPYTGLPNPNHGRLTFLFAHPDDEDPSTNHFHGIGAYSYTGPVTNPTVTTTNTNNRIPEASTRQPPITLSPGRGIHAGRFISKPNGEEYSDLRLASIQSLSGFRPDSPEGFLFHSSGGRWQTPLTGAVVALELVSISPGLQITDEVGTPILPHLGAIHILGDGNNFLFTPVFRTDVNPAVGTYSATFKLKNTGPGSFAESGTFTIDVRVPGCFGARATIVGTEHPDSLQGTKGDDVIVALGGEDRIDGKGGHDRLCGDAGKDGINGGDGNDHIDGGEGDDKLQGGKGDDVLLGGAGDDSIEGGDGNNQIEGGDGNDKIQGRNGDDDLDGGAGIDSIDGGAGTDLCTTGEKVQRCED